MSKPIQQEEHTPSRQFKNTHHDLVKAHDKYLAIVHQEEWGPSDFLMCDPDNHLMYEIHHRDIGHLAEGRACCPEHGFESAWETIVQHEEMLRVRKVEADIQLQMGQHQKQAPAGPGEIPIPEGWRRAKTKNRNRFQRQDEEGATSSVWMEGARNWHYVQTDGQGRTLTTSQGKPRGKHVPTSTLESAIKICNDTMKAYRSGLSQHRLNQDL